MVERAIARRHPERPQPAELRTPQVARDVTMQIDGVPVTASYTPPEIRAMQRNRAAGATDEEQQVLHMVKAEFGVDLVVDRDELADSGKRARAVGSGSQWDDSRNTSNRSGHLYGPTKAQLERQQRDAERLEQQERDRLERERQGTLPIEQGEDGAT